MDDTSKRTPPGLAKGQVWKTDNTYLQIVELGKRLIHYKVLKDPGQPTVMTRLIRADALTVYLMATEATLLGCSPLGAGRIC
ncbi:MAG: hypothetical protein ACLQVX_20020 [Limisphaerales bacterium]